jgi:(E)-4-hydroxy-3-methylbut-2-enyl-diphosphate synthase
MQPLFILQGTMEISRRRAKVVKIGGVYIGGSHPVALQSMTKTRTADIDATLRQIKKLAQAGCEIVRVAVKDEQDAAAIKKIKQGISLPLVADIHFSWRLAMKAIASGADKIRLNPGNIYREGELRSVVSALKEAKIPLRIGVNSGSLRDTNSRRLTLAEKLVASCLDYIKIIEKFKFYDLVISLKGSTVRDTLEAYRSIAGKCAYPLHLGVTATGLPRQGAVKSSIALGVLLSEGIGDTLRVSLTDDPVEEVAAAKSILEALELRHFGPEIISCPTCGRCEVNLASVVKKIEDRLTTNDQRLTTNRPLKIALMGCVVNGPGEAGHADIGIAFGKKDGLLFKNGKPVRKVPVDRCLEAVVKEMESRHALKRTTQNA